MDWHLLAFIAPLLWATSNYIDKFQLTKSFDEEDGSFALVVLSGLVGALVSIIILFFGVDVISASTTAKLLLVINGILAITSFIPYYKAIKDEDPVGVIPIFQTVPVFGYFLALIFLGEQLTLIQILAGLIVIFGAVGLSVDIKDKFVFKARPFFLMLLSSFILAISGLIFKKFALEESYWVASYWEYIGYLLVAVVIIAFSKSSRKLFVSLFSRKRSRALYLAITEEGLSTTAALMYAFATLLAPYAIVATVVNGLQPFYIYMLGVMFTLVFPRIFKEKATKRDLIHKLIFIVIIFIGTYLLGRST